MTDDRISISGMFGGLKKKADCKGCKNCKKIYDKKVDCKKEKKAIDIPDFCGNYDKR